MGIPSIVGDGVSSVPQPKFPEGTCHPRLGETPDTQWPFGSPRFDVAVRPVIQPRSTLVGGGGGEGTGVVLLKNLASWRGMRTDFLET